MMGAHLHIRLGQTSCFAIPSNFMTFVKSCSIFGYVTRRVNRPCLIMLSFGLQIIMKEYSGLCSHTF